MGHKRKGLAYDDLAATRLAVLGVFKELRKQNFRCRANHECCQSCAGYAMVEKISSTPYEKAKKIKGIIFWHHQDEKSFWSDGRLMIAYGEANSSVHGTVGLQTKEVGEVLKEALEVKGLKVEWDGTEAKRICVIAQPAEAPKKEEPTDELKEEKEVEPERKGPKFPNIQVQLVGQDGNSFAIIGKVGKALRRAGVSKEERDKFIAEATSGDYDHLLQTAMKWVTVG